MAHMELNAVTL